MSNQNQSQQVSNEDLRPVVKELLKTLGLATLTPEDVLQGKFGGKFREMAVQLWLKKQKDDADELAKTQAKEFDQLFAATRDLLGFDPISPKEWDERKAQAAAAAKAKAIAAAAVPEVNEIPEAVTALREELVKMLPSFVFEHNRKAVTFGGWLGKWNNKVKEELSYQDLAPEFRQALVERKRQMNELFQANLRVIVAWGLDSKARTGQQEFHELCAELEVEGGRFYWLTQPPVVETAEEKATREAAENKAKADKAERDTRFNELQGNLKARLKEANPELPDEAADLMATKVAKKVFKKHGDSLPDIKTIFITTAIIRMDTATIEFEQNTAKIYAKAAGMTDEELEAEVKALRDQRDAKNQPDGQAAKPGAADRSDPHFGEIKPATIAAKAAAQNGKKAKKAGQNGQQQRK